MYISNNNKSGSESLRTMNDLDKTSDLPFTGKLKYLINGNNQNSEASFSIRSKKIGRKLGKKLANVQSKVHKRDDL